MVVKAAITGNIAVEIGFQLVGLSSEVAKVVGDKCSPWLLYRYLHMCILVLTVDGPPQDRHATAKAALHPTPRHVLGYGDGN